MTAHEKRVEELVDLLGCSIFEAEKIIEDDKKIDKNQEVDFGLSKEEEKKADTTKEGVIQAVFDFLVKNGYENVEITNKSKLISFKIADDSYEFNLIRKRKPKEK